MKRAILIAGVACGIGLLVGCGPPAADQSIESTAEASERAVVEIVDQAGASGGFTYAVDVDGARAAFGRGRTVVVADVSDPSAPEELYAVALPGDVRDLVLRDGLIYAAADSAGLQIIDAASAAVVGAIRFDDRAHGVAVDGDRVYVAARSQGLRVVDASEPATPREIGHLITADEAVGVVLQDGMAYVAAWYESMRIVDVQDPSAPVEVGFASYDSYDHGAVWSVAVDGDLGLLLIPEKGFRAVDVSDPANVRIHSRYRSLRAPTAAALVGSTAFVADQDAGLRVFDLSDLSQPTEISSIDLPGRVMDVTLSGEIAYVAAKEGGLRLVDVSSPRAPREIGLLDADDAVVDVVSAGGLLLAAGVENGVYRYDANSLVRLLDAPARRITMDGGRVVSAGNDGIRLYEEGRLLAASAGKAHGAAARGDLVAAAGPLGVRVIETVPNGSLRERGTFAANAKADVGHLYRTPSEAWDVVLTDSLAYAAFDDGIYRIDLTDRREPALAGWLETPERVYRLAFAGDRLVAACDDGIRLIDVSGPLTEIAYVKTPSFATALLVDGDTIYAGDLNGNVTAISDGQPIGTWRVADRVLGLARTERGIAVAAGAQGIRVMALPPNEQ